MAERGIVENGMEGVKRYWGFLVAIVGATALVILFFFQLLDAHVDREHEALYAPRYPGDSVQRAIEELRAETRVTISEEAADAEKRFARLEDKIDQLLTIQRTMQSDVAVLKAQIK